MDNPQPQPGRSSKRARRPPSNHNVEQELSKDEALLLSQAINNSKIDMGQGDYSFGDIPSGPVYQ